MKSAIHACKFFLTLDPPDSQVSEGELDCLLSYARGADVVVEIGCYEGGTTAALARQTQGRVYSIDPFFKARLGVSYGELIARTHCRRQGLNNVEFIKAFSHEVVAGFSKPIDLLFIDAEHTFEAVKRDWEDWFPKVKNGGLIALHDCRSVEGCPDYFGSMRFYDEYLTKAPFIEEVGGVESLVVFKVVR
jgi:predicted O-methyltransferase YrrM